jgi:adenine specific DNA methylase Mod
MPQQVQEWRDLGMIGEDFRLEMLTQEDLTGAPLHPQYQHLPIDTKYFTDLELDILALFDDLDAALDGWLIKSENYQALNTILPKFRERVQTIYIDPPFNTGDDFDYVDRFQNSSWISLLNNRLELAKLFLNKFGNIFVQLDWNANHFGRMLLQNLFRNCSEIIWNTNATKDEEAGLFSYKSFGDKYVRQHDTIFQCAIDDNFKFLKLWKPNRNLTELNIGWLDLISKPNKHTPKKIDDYDFFIEKYDMNGHLRLEKININEKIFPIGDIWNDIYSFMQSELRTSESLGFKTQKPENLIRRVIQSTTEIGDLVFDFFCGSGTAISVAQKLKRKWLGVEVSNYFNEFWLDKDGKKLGILGRMKIVASGDKFYTAVDKKRRSHLSKDINYQGGGFFKYYELEQYEDVLRLAHYEDAILFHDPSQDPYNAYVFRPDLKLLEGLEADAETNTVHFHPERLYPDPAKPSGTSIDLAETLSHLRGKWIKRITAEYVEFEDGEQMSLTDPDWQTLKPMIWWQ